MKRNILFLLSLCMLLLTCSDGNDPIKEIEKPKEENPFITLKKANIDFTNDGGSESISIESNVTWTAKSSASWCTVTPSGGNKSTASITLTAPANEDYDNRSCTITIESGGISKTVTVNQGENLGLLVTHDRYELSNEESTIKVEVKANVEFEVEINDEWITKIETRGLTTTELEFKIAENDTYDNREGSITINQKDGDMVSTISIFQSQEDALILSEKDFDISSEAQSVEVEVKTNIDYEIIIPEDAKDWVSHATTRALRTETVVLDIAENKDYDERIAKITIKDKKTNMQETVSIKQIANTGLIVSTDKYELTNDGGTIEVEVKANVEFVIEISDSWIAHVKTRGLTTNILTFEIAKSEEFTTRHGIISLKSRGLEQEIKVSQDGKKVEDNVWDGEISESFYYIGEGTQSSPYLITTCGQIAKLIQNVNNGNSYKGQHFKLVANLNFNNYNTQPIGNKNNLFSGKFDGNYKTIKRLNISGDSYIALFGYTDQASIRNLTIFDSSINGKSYVGAFIGYASSTFIENCSSDVSIKSGEYIGGLIGAAENSKIFNCNHQNQEVGNRSSSHIGGLVGETKNTHIINSYNSGKIYGSDCVGGLVGYSDKESKIENCYNKGSFPDFYYITTLGGIVGYNCGTIENCYSIGIMSGKTISGDMGAVMSGGVVGYNHTTAFLSYCYFLKQLPINKMFSYCGDLNWGTNRKCGSFNASGVLEYGLAFSNNNLLRHSLNDWVNANQTGDNIYKQWRTDMGWPDFVE